MDWDKLRIFHAAAEAGSFTHAGEKLDMSQSAVSRQVSALEQDLNVPLFHRHARGLILTEQGELLFRTAREVLVKLDQVRTRLVDTREKPSGLLRVTTTVGLGTSWLTARVHEFIDLHPDVQLELILDDDELDLSMRQADIALRIRAPVQPDLIQRKLFTVHFHLYASQGYLKRFGNPETLNEISDDHRIVTFGLNSPSYLRESMNWLESAGRTSSDARRPVLRINSLIGMKRAVQRGVGIALLPDYLIESDSELVQLIPAADVPSLDCYFVYPEELRNTARVKVFRDFLIAKAERWIY
ncbi:MAG: LysR family transcriptional regulator [Ancalomicrobiaceae bacterium]|nr:LysR family transcriptional regulator [Ancalomicrobiaceae bacterium]